MSVLPDRRYAWRLVQLAELLRRSHRLHEQALIELDRVEIAAELADREAVALSESVTARLEAYGDAIADLAGQLHVLTTDLPAEAVEITAGDVAREAAADLAAGIFDEQRALLAARVLSVTVGWPALAEGLRGGDGHWSWETTDVAGLLGRFRGARGEDVTLVLAEARIRTGTPFALCTFEQIARLADELERHGAGVS